MEPTKFGSACETKLILREELDAVQGWNQTWTISMSTSHFLWWCDAIFSWQFVFFCDV
jgi:hypothetical protein